MTLSLSLISLYCWRNGTTGRLSNQPEVTSPAGRGFEFKPRVYIQRPHFLPTCLLLPFLSSHHKTPHTQFTALPPCLHLYCYPYPDCQFLSSLWPTKKCHPYSKCHSNVNASLKSCLISLFASDLSILEIENFPKLFTFTLFSYIITIWRQRWSTLSECRMGPQLFFSFILLCPFHMKPTKAVLLEEVELLSCLGPGVGRFLLHFPSPFESKTKAWLRNGKNFAVSQFLLW